MLVAEMNIKIVSSDDMI